MKFKRYLPLLLIPMALASCAKPLSVEQLKEYIDTIQIHEDEYPYYRVVGAIDFNNTYIEVDSEFTEDFREGQFIPYSRYNPGSFDPDYDTDYDEKDTMSFANASKSYWARMPMRITGKSFYGEAINPKGVKEINSTCDYYKLHSYMKPWAESQVKNADSIGKMKMEFIKADNGEINGFVFYATDLHSLIHIDNYPEYPDINTSTHFPFGIEGYETMYQNQIEARFNFRFEYNKDSWLTREYIATTNYNPSKSHDTQFYCEALYTYSFNA